MSEPLLPILISCLSRRVFFSLWSVYEFISSSKSKYSVRADQNMDSTLRFVAHSLRTICMAEEPQSLYLYDGRSDKAKWNVLDALYDGPIDQVGYQLQAVILEGIPDLAGGGLRLEAIAVQPGQEVVDANGRLTVLKKGVFVRPSGCQESACAVTWDGQDDFLMDRMVLEFKLIEGLLWSKRRRFTF